MKITHYVLSILYISFLTYIGSSKYLTLANQKLLDCDENSEKGFNTNMNVEIYNLTYFRSIYKRK